MAEHESRVTDGALEADARRAASGLYHATSAVLMAWEATRPSIDARRALLSRLVLDHRLSAPDPLAPASFDWEGEASELIFADRKIEMPEIAHLLA